MSTNWFNILMRMSMNKIAKLSGKELTRRMEGFTDNQKRAVRSKRRKAIDIMKRRKASQKIGFDLSDNQWKEKKKMARDAKLQKKMGAGRVYKKPGT